VPAGVADWRAEANRLLAPLAPAAREKVLEGVRGNIATLADLPGEVGVLAGGELAFEPEAAGSLAAPGARELCAALAEALGSLAQWTGEGFKSAIQAAGKQQGRKGKELFMPVRAALTGRTHGPELPLLAELLGQDRCIARLQDAARHTG
jgi:glutamyl/glutaminyl-tRNA synthetase